MKLDCGLVEDLYPLYIEKELKPENQHAVDEHLKSCSHCNQLYQEGTGFTDVFEPGEETLSKDLDDRIWLRFRLRRMKIVAALLAAVMIVTAINQYAANREKIATLLNGMYMYSESLNELANNPYINTNTDYLSYSMDDIIDLGNELSWFERMKNNSYHFIVDTQELDEMAATLRERNSQGLEDQTDREAVELLQKYTNALYDHVQKEYDEFHHGYSSYFEILDVEGIGKPINQIEELAYLYNRYHKLPSEMKPLSKTNLKEILASAFHTKNSKIKLEEAAVEGTGIFNFDLKDNQTEITGVINGYTGTITFANNISDPLSDEQPKSTEELVEGANKILKSIYGEHANFEIKPENGDSGQNSTRFWFTPFVGEHKMHFPTSDPFVIELDAGTGELYMLSAKTAFLSKEFFTKDYTKELSQEKIEHKASEFSGKKTKPVGKGIVFSPISADYVLVYIFEGEGNQFYINAETGIVEGHSLPIYY